VPVRGLQHGDLRANALEPDHTVHPIALDQRLALQLESERGEECDRVREVVDDYAHVVHPLDCHVLDGRHATELALSRRIGHLADVVHRTARQAWDDERGDHDSGGRS
jgi:hypothetical protein